MVAACIVVDIIMEHRSKLRMLGLTILGMSVFHGNHTVVITNESIPASNIKKKLHLVHIILSGKKKEYINMKNTHLIFYTMYVNTF